jgi:tetrahydromethanopterin S-methyltransferase subunit F
VGINWQEAKSVAAGVILAGLLLGVASMLLRKAA